MLEISSKQKRITAPIRLSLDLSGCDIKVTVTTTRRSLPKDTEDFIKWATVITGALHCSLNHHPPIRRKQFSIDLREPCKTWVSSAASKHVQALKTCTRDKVPGAEAENIVITNGSQCEAAVALSKASILALHYKLPVKITVKLNNKGEPLPPANLTTTLADFAKRLSLSLAMVRHREKRQPGGATQDCPLTFWVGMAAAVADQIVMEGLAKNGQPSPELKAILQEASNIKGLDKIERLHDRRRFYNAFIVARALRGNPDLRRLSALAPLMRSELNSDKIVSQIESFHYTYVQPNAQKLQSDAVLSEVLTRYLRPRLLGKPGALSSDLPKSAF